MPACTSTGCRRVCRVFFAIGAVRRLRGVFLVYVLPCLIKAPWSLESRLVS